MGNHIIKRQILDMSINSEGEAKEWQEDMRILFYDQLLPLIESYLDEYDQGNTLIRLDKLTLDLGELDPEHFQLELVEKLKEALTEKLSEHIVQLDLEPAIEEQNGEVMSISTAKLELIMHFLSTGNIPWWKQSLGSLPLEDTFREILESHPEQLERILIKELEKKTVRQRLVYQFSDNLVDAIIDLIYTNQARFVKTASELFQVQLSKSTAFTFNPRQVRQAITASLLALPAKNYSQLNAEAFSFWMEEIARELSIPVRLIHQQFRDFPIGKRGTVDERDRFELLVAEVLSQQVQDSETSPTGETQTTTEEEQGPISGEDKQPEAELSKAEEIVEQLLKEALDPEAQEDGSVEECYVANAGVVILWPYLQTFFDFLELTENGAFKNNLSQQKAVHLIEYLATGSGEHPEYHLGLNKLLCGLKMEDPVIGSIQLSTEEKAEAEKLLSAVIRNWPAIGNTSPDAFRETFLQREGRLNKKDYGWELKVNQKPYDMLLEQLPWSINLVKLGWMKQPIHVEW